MNNEWMYIDEYRRYKGNTHQLYKEGEWIDINFSLNEEGPSHEQ